MLYEASKEYNLGNCLKFKIFSNLEQGAGSKYHSMKNSRIFCRIFFFQNINFFFSLRQTIYHRIENLLLDPGKKSTEKQQIIDSAVDNYHRQKMILPETDDGTTHYDITDLTGKALL